MLGDKTLDVKLCSAVRFFEAAMRTKRLTYCMVLAAFENCMGGEPGIEALLPDSSAVENFRLRGSFNNWCNWHEALPPCTIMP